MKNYDIIQLPHSYSFVLGFYGKCDGSESDDECVDYNMNESEFRRIVDSVFEVDGSQSGGTFSWYKSALYQTDLNHFHKLTCGKLYYFVVKPGVTRINIPHLFITNSTESNEGKGRVTTGCEFIPPTPTPDGDCCKDFSNSILATGTPTGTENLNGIKLFRFQYGGLFCYHSLEITNLPSRFNFKTEEGDILGYITTTGTFKNKEVRYTAANGACYVGFAETQNGFNILEKR